MPPDYTANESYFKTCERERGHCVAAGEGGAAAAEDKSKFIGQPVGTKEIHHAAAVVQAVADAVGGKVTGDTEPKDVEVGCHSLEVKSMLKGSKKEISVHPDALVRKVDDQKATGSTYHTVVVDERQTYDGGEHAENYSGHRLYYKRGCGRYPLAKMYKVQSMDHLRELLDTADNDLPKDARGRLPRGREARELRERAARATEARRAKDQDRKERLKRAGSSAYERQT